MKNKSRIEKVLDLLWGNQGTYIGINNLTLTPTQAKKVFQEVIQFLQMMGIAHQADTSRYRIRILSEKQNQAIQAAKKDSNKMFIQPTITGKNYTSIFLDEWSNECVNQYFN